MGSTRFITLLVGITIVLGVRNVSFTQEKKWVPPNYIRELRYTCYPDKIGDLIAYFTRLAEADIKENSGRMRWMDSDPYGQLVIAGIPAYHLEEYDNRVGSGTVFTRAFGADEYRKYSAGYSNAQMRTHSVIRKYRDDLSMNRDKHLRATTKFSLYTYVTVKPGKAKLFEHSATKTIAACKQIAPDYILSAAQTIAGGGPEYLFVAPFKSYADLEKAIDAGLAVEKAFVKVEAVESTESVIMQKTAKDSFVP